MRTARHIWALAVVFVGCASVQVPSTPLRVRTQTPSAGATRTVEVAGIGSCDERDVRPATLHDARPLHAQRALVVLVHGAHSSGDGFRVLAETFATNGQQAVCFRYDGRQSLLSSASRLRGALVALVHTLHAPSITLLGHSQGGLVARAALSTQMREPLPASTYRLITVSTPFAGIYAARFCGSLPYHLASFGVSAVVCRAISGAGWNQLHAGASMVREPAALEAAVREHLEVVTDERDTCRRFSSDGRHCLQDDFVFSMAEQHNVQVERDARVVAAALRAGHVEAVGGRGTPRKLVEALREHGVLARELDEPAATLEAQSAKRGW